MSTHAQNGNGGVLGMLKKIVASESFSGIFLFLCAVLAMIVANSPLGDMYRALWHFHWGFSWGGTPIELSMEHWINDVLMSFFFLVVGLEIKYELIYGALASFKKAAFPVLAALGGMVVPGLIYYSLNMGTHSENGFGI
ncbi:MAG: Na+/H+ antiporter NhaA, partial [Helicobacter sp.]|nr:Na+/H+ antiporter NhaA [Helicobacter sp.]